MEDIENPIYPTPLTPTKSPPPFPLDSLPQTIRNMVEFVSETTQVYPDMPAAVALAALSVCLQGKAKVYFSEHWAEELNLYILISAPPGERKSAVFSAMTKPITKYVIDYNEKHRLEVQTYYNTRRQLELKLNKAIEKDKDADTIKKIQMGINALTPVSELKLITTDVTAEALAAIMSVNGEVMGIMSPEGGIFDVISGMYSNNVTNINIFLSSYDGEPVKIDRRYGSVALRRPLLTFGICTQPIVLNKVINDPQFCGKGLTQRFLFCLPNSMIGHRKLIQDVDGSTAIRDYRELITAIVEEAKRTYRNGAPVYRYGYLIILILNTGMREGEPLYLKWKDVDLEKRRIYIHGDVVEVKNRAENAESSYICIEQETPKTDKSTRYIPLNDNAVDALENLRRLVCAFTPYVVLSCKS